MLLINTNESSVDCGERVYGYFRFALRCPDGAISGQKRVFLGCFLGFLAPKQAGRPGEPRSDQSEAEFGSDLAFIYIHNREMGGGPLLVKKGVFGLFWGGFRLPNKQDVPGKGAKQEGGLSELPMRPYPGAAYGVAQMISSKYPGYLIFGTTYLAPQV